MVFHKELEAIQTNHPEIAVVFVDGMITDETLAPHLAAWKDAVWYLSGPQPMVIGMNTLLTQSGIPQEQILSEEFYAPAGLFADIADDRLRAVMEEQGRIFRLAVEQSPMHVVFTDVNGRILYANYNAERITGYTYKEMIGQTPRLWGGMMSKDLYHKLWETIKGKRQEYDGEFWNRRKNGEVYLAHGKIAPIQDEQGNLIGFVATEEDITDERRLEEESARLSAIVASSGDAIVAKTLQGTINAWNQGAERLYGYTAEEAIGQDAQLIVPEENRAEYIRMVNEARTGKIISQVKTVRRRKDGSLIDISLTYSPIYKDGVVIGISAIGHDITKEQTLARKESEFISIASHQLRTPMTGIRWVIERLAKKEHLSEKGKEYVADIEASIKTLSGLVETLLNTSRIDARTVGTAPEIVNVSQFIKGYCTECQPLAEGKKITFSFTDETDPSGTIATTDPLALRNIIQSLVSNAIEYTPEAGTVEVTLQNIERGFRIVVKDSGIGIPLKDRSLIFSKFGRASNASVVKPGGTGLGLYITQNAVTLLGGTIRFESEEGKGTAFIVELPLVSNPITGPKRMV
jgi:PAS domain S-box-containing protein